MIRAILDANVVISAMIAPLGASANILQAWRADYFDAVVCPALLGEIEEKLRLPRIAQKYSISDAEVVNLLLRFASAAYTVPGLASVNPIPPDAKDAMLFSAAIESQADYIVTGDKLLLRFVWPGPGKVVTPRQFWESELPVRIISDLTYPLFSLEDVLGSGFATILDEAGRSWVAVFTTEASAENYLRKNSMVAEPKRISAPRELASLLREARAKGLNGIALNSLGKGSTFLAKSLDEMAQILEESA